MVVAVEMRGKQWEYISYYLKETERGNFNILAKMEKDGWEVLNITGISPGDDAIWFRRKLKKERAAPVLHNPCKHNVENGHMNCIHCGPPV